MDSLEYEQAALKNLDPDRGQPGPGQVAVAEVYAVLAVAAEAREIRRVLASCAARDRPESL